MSEIIQIDMYIVFNIIQSYIRYKLHETDSVSLSLVIAQDHSSRFLHTRTGGT